MPYWICKICQYLRLYMKTICWTFLIKKSFTFWDMHTEDMWKVCLQTFRNNRICLKIAYFLRNLQTSRGNNSRILRIKNAKFLRYCFYINKNTKGDFQICISVPLKTIRGTKKVYYIASDLTTGLRHHKIKLVLQNSEIQDQDLESRQLRENFFRCSLKVSFVFSALYIIISHVFKCLDHICKWEFSSSKVTCASFFSMYLLMN